MYGVITEDYVKNQNDANKTSELKISLAKIYLILLLLSGGAIYFYSVYQDDYLQLLIPYTVIWPISLILVGISIFRVKNTASFSVGFFITSLSVGLTIVSIFVYSTNVKNNLDTKLISVQDVKQLVINIDLVATKSTIKSDNKNLFLADFSSNYDKANINNYTDENKIENIKLDQKSFPPGLGSYSKFTNITLPKNIPTTFDAKINLSIGSIDLSEINLASGIFDIRNSQLEIKINNLNNNDSKIDIKSRLSNINLLISKDIKVDIVDNSEFSKVEFEGMEKDNTNDSIYRTSINSQLNTNNNLSDKKKLTINLNSTLSNVRIIQK